jgi:hypothetical protein
MENLNKEFTRNIFEDIQGYAGSEDWKTFYAVIYQTDHFMTQAQIDEEFKLSKVDHNWKPISPSSCAVVLRERPLNSPISKQIHHSSLAIIPLVLALSSPHSSRAVALRERPLNSTMEADAQKLS